LKKDAALLAYELNQEKIAALRAEQAAIYSLPFGGIKVACWVTAYTETIPQKVEKKLEIRNSAKRLAWK
jgi:hypothetical protein